MTVESGNRISKSELEAKVDILQAKIKYALEKVKRSRSTNRRKASLVKLSTTLFSAAATVLLGLKISGFEAQFKDIAFIFTALVTLLNALEPFFNFRALWVEHEAALWKFYRLRDKIEYYLAGQASDDMNLDKIDSFHNEYQDIWDNLSQSWISYRKQEK